MRNPVLIELTRGALVESRHAGALALVRSTGEHVLTLGDVGSPIFPRSAIKALQCLPLLESGAADRFGFGPEEIALACASHSGTQRHTALAASMLERAGLGVADLGCGAHEPHLVEAARRLARRGETPTALHNNCSGKHAGMLATAMFHGESADGYLHVEHQVQRRIAGVLEDFTGQPLGGDTVGTDGCSAPNWAIPLERLARAFACFITGEGLAKPRRAACERIASSCWAAPELVAGAGRLDTALMRQYPNRVFSKTGAEGVYCAALPEQGLGLAVKIDDGAKRASEAVLLAVLDRYVAGTAGLRSAKVTNWRGLDVGEIRIAPELRRALDAL